MPIVHFGSTAFDVDLIAFDKDGTLIAFDAVWGIMAEAWASAMVVDGDAAGLDHEILRSWGYDPHQHRTTAESPLAIATTGQLQAIAAAVLYSHGVAWTVALDRVRAAFDEVADELPLAQLMEPLADVAGLFGQLRGAGVQVAVVTADHRTETELTLNSLGVNRLVNQIICGDDGLLPKPAPDMLLTACYRSAVTPARTAAVGDTLGDMLMAERAGAGLRVAVLSGVGDSALLERHANVVLDSIADIRLET
jgi:phosphoglycolate phosphatase-like HAD superfamily hydrolase